MDQQCAGEEPLQYRAWWQGLGTVGVWLLVGFSFVPNSYYAMVAFPWMLWWQGGFLLLAIASVGMCWERRGTFRLLGYGLDGAVGAVAIACLGSILLAAFPRVALGQGVTVLGYGVLLYFVRNLLGQGFWHWRKLWRSLVLAGIGGGYWSLLGWWGGGQPDQNFFPLGHHNFVAAYICLILPLVVGYGLAQTGKVRILSLLSLLPLFFVLYTCGSRGGFVGFLGWAIVGVGCLLWTQRGRQRLIIATIASVVLVLLLGIVLQNPRVERIIRVNLAEPNQPAVQWRVDGQTTDRFAMWQTGLNILRDRPLTGVGLGNMARVYNLYRPVTVGSGAAHVQQLHSTPMQLLGELGLVGGGAIAYLLYCLVRLGWQVHQGTDNPRMRQLLYGVGGGWLAYGGATLTDYQLENIPISLTLTISVALVVAMADQTFPGQKPAAIAQQFSHSSRIWLGLGSVIPLLSALLWTMPVTLSMYLFTQGQWAWTQGNTKGAFLNLAIAKRLHHWSPNYTLRLGFWFLEWRESRGDAPEDYRRLTELVLQSWTEAWATIPNDYYLNQNIGLLWLELDPAKAQPYLERAVQLFPRQDYGIHYLLLAQSYLQQGQRDKAIAALALQGLMDPESTTWGIWQTEPFATIRLEAVAQCVVWQQTLAAQLAPGDPLGLQLQEQMAWMRWWHGLPLVDDGSMAEFSPLVQVLLWGDRRPEAALRMINEQITANPEDDTRWLLLKAWFDPTFTLTLTQPPGEHRPTEEYAITAPIATNGRLQDWLKQLPLTLKPLGDRLASQLTYRSQDFSEVDMIIQPQTLQQYRLVSLLALDRGYPRHFPALDRLMAQIYTEKLGIPHPTENHFQIVTPHG